MEYSKFITLSEIPFQIYPELKISPDAKEKINEYLTMITLSKEDNPAIDLNLFIKNSVTDIITGLLTEIEKQESRIHKDNGLYIMLLPRSVLEFKKFPTINELSEFRKTSLFEVLHHIKVKKPSIAAWFLESDEPEKAKIFHPKITSPVIDVTTEVGVNKNNTFSSITHTSELIEVMKSAIIEHWEGITDIDPKPKNAVVEAWIIANYKHVSPSVAKNIASIIRPQKYK